LNNPRTDYITDGLYTVDILFSDTYIASDTYNTMYEHKFIDENTTEKDCKNY